MCTNFVIKCFCVRQNVHNVACVVIKTHSAPLPPLPATFRALAQGLFCQAEFVSQKILSFCHPQKLKHYFFKCRKPFFCCRLGCGHFCLQAFHFCYFFGCHLADDAVFINFHFCFTPHTIYSLQLLFQLVNGFHHHAPSNTRRS